MKGETSVIIAAPAARVYELLTDVTRMGEWSPETYKAEWIDGATGPAVGARFKGYNHASRFAWIKWSNKPTVIEAEAPRVFAFDTGSTLWRYELEPIEGGVRVTESFATKGDARFIEPIYRLAGRERALMQGMASTLARLKEFVEADG